LIEIAHQGAIGRSWEGAKGRRKRIRMSSFVLFSPHRRMPVGVFYCDEVSGYAVS